MLGERLFAISVGLLFILSLSLAILRKRWSWLALGGSFCIGASVLGWWFFKLPEGSDPGSIIVMGTHENQGETSPIPYIWMYASMVAGMLAQSTHDRLTQAKANRPPLDFGMLAAPVLISPIIFIPLFEAFGEHDTSGKALFLTCLVAFENGFFFKNYLERRDAPKKLEPAP